MKYACCGRTSLPCFPYLTIGTDGRRGSCGRRARILSVCSRNSPSNTALMLCYRRRRPSRDTLNKRCASEAESAESTTIPVSWAEVCEERDKCLASLPRSRASDLLRCGAPPRLRGSSSASAPALFTRDSIKSILGGNVMNYIVSYVLTYTLRHCTDSWTLGSGTMGPRSPTNTT